MAAEKVILRESKKVKSGVEWGSTPSTDKQFYFVTINTSGTIELAVSGSIAYPLMDTPLENEYGTLALLGIAKVICAETIEPNERVAPNNEGKAQKWVAGQYAAGVALEKGEAGQIIAIMVPAPPKA